VGTVAASTENAAIVEETRQSKKKQVLRKHVLDTLNGCLCGEVADSLKLLSNAIIKCEELGCETEWIIDLFLIIFVAYITHLIILCHLSCVELEIKLQKWLCAACEASGQVRGASL
jgi:hypothetical protein